MSSILGACPSNGRDCDGSEMPRNLLSRCGLTSEIRPFRGVRPVGSVDLSTLPFLPWTNEFPYGVRPVPDWVKLRWESCYRWVVESPVKFDLTPPPGC